MSISRRELLGGAVAAGFALAVRPISAETIITGKEGLTEGDIFIPVEGGKFPGYRAMPAKGGPFPVVIVVHEIFGVHEYIRDICRRLAKAGYFAVAPYLYSRQGDVMQLSDINTIVYKVVSKVPDEQVMNDLDATVAWAKSTAEADVDRLAITGFCWGGRVVWMYAAHNPNVKAGVAWYGRIIWQKNARQPQHPLDIAASLKVPVLGLYGAKDRSIPVDTVEQMRKALKDANSKSEIVIYADAAHGFNADYRDSYNEHAAKDGWKRMLAWFAKYGVR
jgi:carboxymethylenebutenolidase